MKLITCTQGRKISHYTTVWWELALLQFHGVDELWVKISTDLEDAPLYLLKIGKQSKKLGVCIYFEENKMKTPLPRFFVFTLHQGASSDHLYVKVLGFFNFLKSFVKENFKIFGGDVLGHF